MSKLNFLVYLNTYSDARSSNAPSLSNFKWTREIEGIPAANPISETFSLAPSESKSVFNGVRTLLADNTTRYDIELKPFSTNTYRISASAGTQPAFKTLRSIGTSAISEIDVTVNGPTVTFTGQAASAGATATFTGQVAGMTTDVTFDAENEGAAGNDIELVGDGTSTLVELADAWNLANPSNEVVQDIGDFSQVPDLGATIQLSGGADAVGGLDTTTVVVGDLVRIGDQFDQSLQGEFPVISKGPNSFTVKSYSGVNQSDVVLGSDFAHQIRIYSYAGVQKGDTLVLKSGFSPVTFGSYKITDLTDEWIEVYSTAVLPQESNVTSLDLAIYSHAKNFIYLEADQKCTVTINGVQMASMEPFIINDSKQPGVFMLKATVFSFSVQNNSLETASCFVASVE